MDTRETAMNSTDADLQSDPDGPRNEAELLERESRLAREALGQVRSEIFESLSRTADVGAWTSRFPWPALGTAAVAGVGVGWGLGRSLWRSRKTSRAARTAGPAAPVSPSEPTHATGRLIGGLGTLVGAFASAAVVAATEAVKEMVKEKVHETFHGEPDTDAAPEP
jgi:hypothetical protein